VEDPERQKRAGPVARHQPAQPWFQGVARLVGDIAGDPVPLSPQGFGASQGRGDGGRTPGRDHFARGREQRRFALWSEFEKDHRDRLRLPVTPPQ
jgi:hypothetical protein